jgi:hypothetical protein
VNVDFIDRMVESRIAEAIERGDLDPGPLKGKPIDDLDRPRPHGWWAEQFVRRERSRLAREEALERITSWRVQFWRAATIAELRVVVEQANRWAELVNRRLVAEDAIPLFDADEVERSWRSLSGQRARSAVSRRTRRG